MPTQFVDLKVFYSNSDSNREPNEKKNTKVVSNPKYPIGLSAEDGSEKFKTHFIYFTLYSATGCCASIVSTFAADKIKKQEAWRPPVEEEQDWKENNLLCMKKFRKHLAHQRKTNFNYLKGNILEAQNFSNVH